MKRIKIFYWIFTILFSIMMFGSAIPDVLSLPDAVKGMHGVLGYPVYFVPFVGVAKMLGVIAILIPGFPRIKEWAYAGLSFDLIAATYSLACVPNNPQQGGAWYVMIVPLAVAAAAYVFYRKKTQAEKF